MCCHAGGNHSEEREGLDCMLTEDHEDQQADGNTLPFCPGQIEIFLSK